MLSAAGLVAYSGALIDPCLHTRSTAVRIAADLQGRRAKWRRRRVTLWLEAGPGQFPVIVARLEGTSRGLDGPLARIAATIEVVQSRTGYSIARIVRPRS